MSMYERLGNTEEERYESTVRIARKSVPFIYRKITGTSFAESFLSEALKKSSTIDELDRFYKEYHFWVYQFKRRPSLSRVIKSLRERGIE